MSDLLLRADGLRRHIGNDWIWRGVDLGVPLDAETRAEIFQAWERHGVLVFRDQDIGDREHVAFSRNFGELEVLPEKDHTGDRLPEIFILTNVGDDGRLLPVASEPVTFTTLTLSTFVNRV